MPEISFFSVLNPKLGLYRSVPKSPVIYISYDKATNEVGLWDTWKEYRGGKSQEMPGNSLFSVFEPPKPVCDPKSPVICILYI